MLDQQPIAKPPALDPEFWREKPVLLTGHTGFKGAWLSLWLSQLGAKVYGYSLGPTTPSLYELGTIDRALAGEEFADIRDIDRLSAFAHRIEPSVILHLAAQAFVRESYREPLHTFAVNVTGTANVLDVARSLTSLEAVLVVTSDKCYRNDDRSEAFAEDAPLGGDDPYSASKACAEIVTEAYRTSFFNEGGIALATARAGNVIGGGDWSTDRIVPDIVASLLQGRELTLRYPEATRPWQHVLEPLFGYLVLTQAISKDRSFVGAWNFGPEEKDSVSVGELVAACYARWGSPLEWVKERLPQPHEHGRLVLNVEKASRLLGLEHYLSFEQRCAWTIDWYKRLEQGESARALCIEQIAQYVDLAARRDAIA